MSMARRRAVVINHAPGLSGMPCSGHVSSAATRLSWTTSSARAKSPSTRISAAVSRPASSLKTAATASSVLARVSSAFGMVDYRPDFDDAATGPGLGHLERLVQVFDLDYRKAADDFLGLDERAVRDDSLAVLDANGGGAARTLELGATGDPARPAVL